MKNIMRIFLFSVCLLVLCGCSIHTFTYNDTAELPKLSADKFSSPLYISEVQINYQKQGDVQKIREDLSKQNPKLFTVDAQSGIPAKIDVKLVKNDKEGGTLDLLGILTLGIVPLSSYENASYELILDACGVQGNCAFQCSSHSISGSTPLTYLLYPFVGWFADDKGLSDLPGFSITSAACGKYLQAAAAKIDAPKMMENYSVRPKTVIPVELQGIITDQI